MVCVIGAACSIERSRPVIRAVEGEDGRFTEIFEYASRRDDDWPLQLREVETAWRTALQGRQIAAVVVRLRDFHRRRSVDNSVISRCQTEGVVIAVARAFCDCVRPMDGRAIGDEMGVSKDDVWESAAKLVVANYVDAAAAALAASDIAGRDD